LVGAAGLASESSAQPPERPAENATAARIADGVEKAQAGKLLDAVEQFQRVLDTAGDELVPVDRSQYTPARWVIHGLIARRRDEAKAELQHFRQRFPDEAGLLAGKTGKYVDTLSELINDPSQTALTRSPDAPDWPTFAGSATRRGTNRARLPYFWPDVPSWKA